MAAKRKKKQDTIVTLTEFKAWLTGVIEMQDDDWCPSPAQWIKIRDRIDALAEPEPMWVSPPNPPAPQNTLLQQNALQPQKYAHPPTQSTAQPTILDETGNETTLAQPTSQQRLNLPSTGPAITGDNGILKSSLPVSGEDGNLTSSFS